MSRRTPSTPADVWFAINRRDPDPRFEVDIQQMTIVSLDQAAELERLVYGDEVAQLEALYHAPAYEGAR